jgi:hypothetical protein
VRLPHSCDRLIDKTAPLKDLKSEWNIQVRLAHPCGRLIDKTSSLEDLEHTGAFGTFLCQAYL